MLLTKIYLYSLTTYFCAVFKYKGCQRGSLVFRSPGKLTRKTALIWVRIKAVCRSTKIAIDDFWIFKVPFYTICQEIVILENEEMIDRF